MELRDWTHPDLSLPGTDMMIRWMDKLCKIWRDELKERCQGTISIHLITNQEDDLEEFGSLCWDDFTNSNRIMRYCPPPTIDPHPEVITWASVGRFLVERLKLELFEVDEYEEED